MSEYVERAGGDLQAAGAKATQRAMDGVRDDVRNPKRLPIAADEIRQGRRRSSAARSTRSSDVPRPIADDVAAEEVVRLPEHGRRTTCRKSPRSCASDHTIKAQRLTARFIHNGNLANNVTLAFGFNYCSFKFSRFGL